MAQESAISLKLFASGYCEAHANVVNPIEGKGKDKFYAVWALLHIQDVGYILFDSGYSNEFIKATNPFPERIYRWLTPITLNEKESAKEVLKLNGISTEEVKYIIISHFHADHIAGLRDFEKAQFICTRDAYSEVLELKGFRAVKKGIIHRLLPDDFNNRVLILEEIASNEEINKYGLKEFQLFNNEQLKLVLLPGHAKGMLGFIFASGDESVFYGADAFWSYDTYRRAIFPRKIVKLFFDSWNEFVDTHQRIKAFEADNKQFNILFTHCKQTLKYLSNTLNGVN